MSALPEKNRTEPERHGLWGLGDPVRRNVALLAAAQAMAFTALAILPLTVALVGYALAPGDKSLATLPFGVHFLAMMVTSAPASLIMGRIGRRPGLILGSLCGGVGGLVLFAGVMRADFVLFCLGSVGTGMFASTVGFYRFAAADAAPPAFRPRAISLCLAGGIVGAFLGPEIAKTGRNLFEPVLYAGCYLFVAALALLTITALAFVRIPRPGTRGEQPASRPLRQILAQPTAIAAISSGALGYGVMILLMTSTPLAMHHDGHSFNDSALVIQWHALAMFAPSFLTGSIIARIGIRPVILLGIVLNAACLALVLAGHGLWDYWIGLVCLGLGWNFMFVGGSSLLTLCHEEQERAKVQAVNDFLVTATITLGSFSSGYLYSHIGWAAVNLAMIPALLVATLAILNSFRQTRAAIA